MLYINYSGCSLKVKCVHKFLLMTITFWLCVEFNGRIVCWVLTKNTAFATSHCQMVELHCFSRFLEFYAIKILCKYWKSNVDFWIRQYPYKFHILCLCLFLSLSLSLAYLMDVFVLVILK